MTILNSIPENNRTEKEVLKKITTVVEFKIMTKRTRTFKGSKIIGIRYEPDGLSVTKITGKTVSFTFGGKTLSARDSNAK